MKTGTLDPIANTATWRAQFTIIDDVTGLPFDRTGIAALTVKVRDQDSKSTNLEGSLAGGEVVGVGDAADGVVQITFSAGQMSGLCPKTYEIGVLITATDGFVSQAILGLLPVLEGL